MTGIRVFDNLPIGKKIALGFGLSGLLFFVVVWQYHATLFQALNDFDRLQSVHGAKRTHVLHIQSNMLEARRSEKDFLGRKKTEYADRVTRYVNLVLAEAADLEQLETDAGGQPVGGRIRELIGTYHDTFRDIVEAMKMEGLDHESGLQGRFRETIHAVEARAARFKTAAPYLTLLQIRRAEKDLGLRRAEPYAERVRGLARRFRDQIQLSAMDDAIKSALDGALNNYLESFEVYSKKALAGEPVNDGKGAFRDSAHVLEGFLRQRYVPDLEEDILMLRRHEKDYLLRGGSRYVEMAGGQIRRILDNVADSPIDTGEKVALAKWIRNYERDFLALVEQHDRITALTARMRDAIHQIEPLVKTSVHDAVAVMNREAAATRTVSRRIAFVALAIAAVAIALGAVFAIAITRRITGPVTTLVGLAEMIAGTQQDTDTAAPKDEIAALAAVMGRLTGSHQEMLSRLSKKADTLAAVADDLVAVAHTLEEGKSLPEMQNLSHTVNERAEDLARTVEGLRKMLSRFRTG